MTNIMNTHTCSICSVDVLIAGVGLLGGELVELMRDVMSSSRVRIPRRIYVGLLSTMSTESNNCISRHSNLFLSVTPIIADAEKITVEAFETLRRSVTRYAT
jgi:hypothetical protein